MHLIYKKYSIYKCFSFKIKTFIYIIYIKNIQCLLKQIIPQYQQK